MSALHDAVQEEFTALTNTCYVSAETPANLGFAENIAYSGFETCRPVDGSQARIQLRNFVDDRACWELLPSGKQQLRCSKAVRTLAELKVNGNWQVPKGTPGLPYAQDLLKDTTRCPPMPRILGSAPIGGDGSEVDLLLCFHGTMCATSIARFGFNEAYCARGLYGPGIYLASTVAMAVNYAQQV